MTERESLGFGGDHVNPRWGDGWKTHDWKNYIPEELQAIWQTFNEEQKYQIARMANEMADREEWE